MQAYGTLKQTYMARSTYGVMMHTEDEEQEMRQARIAVMYDEVRM